MWHKGRPQKPGRYLCAISCPKGEWYETLDYTGGRYYTVELLEDATEYVVAWKEIEPYGEAC